MIVLYNSTPSGDEPALQSPTCVGSGCRLEGGLEKAPNPSYQADPCRWQRYLVLLGMNKWECDMCATRAERRYL